MNAKVTRFFGNTKLWAIRNKPEIMYWTGIASGGVALVSTIKATLKVQPILDDFNQKIFKIHDDVSTGKLEYGMEAKALTKVYAETAFKLVKLYSPAIAAAAISIALTRACKNELNARNLQLATAYAGLDAAYKACRKEAERRYGSDAGDLPAPRSMLVDETTGEVKDEGKPEEVGDYGRLFAAGYTTAWQPNNSYNITFLKAQQAYANQILAARGYLFLHEVYSMLGLKDSEAAHVVGWIYDDNNADGDNFVSFGIDNLSNPRVLAYMQGETDEVWLDFNCQGMILNKIGLEKM